MAYTGPLNPLPMATHPLVLGACQSAMRLAVAPLAVVTSPPAYTSRVKDPLTALMARTVWLNSVPSADQEAGEPPHVAMRLKPGEPVPAAVNSPPAMTSSSKI